MLRAPGAEIGQLLRFALVGASNLLFDLFIFNILWALLGHRPGLAMGAANGAAYALATVAGYLANRFWSFRRQGMLGGYLVVYAITGAMAAVGLPMVAALAAGTLGSGVLLANAVKVAYTLVLAGLNYTGLRLFVFRPDSSEAATIAPRPTVPASARVTIDRVLETADAVGAP